MQQQFDAKTYKPAVKLEQTALPEQERITGTCLLRTYHILVLYHIEVLFSSPGIVYKSV